MPRGEDVEIAELADFLLFLAALFPLARRALTFAFLHETSIVIRESGRCESPEKYKLSTFYASLRCRARPDASRLIDRFPR